MPEPGSVIAERTRRREVLLALGERIRDFRRRPFPEGWAKVVNGVGLASLSMRAEFSLYGVPAFTCVYLDAHHYPEPVVSGLGGIIESWRAYREDVADRWHRMPHDEPPAPE